MTVVIGATAGPSPTDLLQVFGDVLVGGVIGWYLAAFVLFMHNRKSSAAADVRALRRGRVPLPAGLSPEPAGLELAASSQTFGGQQAVEAFTPDSVSTAPGEQR